MKTARRWMLAVALLGPTCLAWVYFVQMAPPSHGKGSPGLLALSAYALSKVAQFSLPIVWVILFERQRVTKPGFKTAGLGLGIGFGLFVIALTFGLYFAVLRHSPILKDTPAKVLEKISAFHIGTPGRFVLMSLFLAGAHSLMEEYYWRWFVFGELRQELPSVAAIMIASLGFMSHHVVVLMVYFPNQILTAAVPFSLAVAAGGAFWCWLYQRSGNIVACWASHVVADLAIMAVGYDMIFVK